MFSSFWLVPAAAFLVFLAFTTLFGLRTPSKARSFTHSLPWIGTGRGPWSGLWAMLRSVTKSEDMVQEGYTPV
jgi:hypothetical protein